MRNAIFILSLLWTSGVRAQNRIEWETNYGGSSQDQANAVRQTADGGYVAAGKSLSSDGDLSGNYGGEDIWVVKTGADGVLQWQHHFGGSADERAEDIIQTFDGGYVVAGYSRSSDGDVGGNNGSWDMWILKLDAAGDLEWERNYGGSNNDLAYCIRQTLDTGFVIAGSSQSNNGDVGANFGNADYWVVKTDAAGNIQWEQNYGGNSADVAYSMILSADGAYVLAGQSQSANGDVGGNNGAYDYWVLKLNTAGAILWSHNYGGTDADLAKEILETADGGLMVAGTSFSSNGNVGSNNGICDFWLLKLDAAGNQQWSRVYGGLSYDEAESICQSADGGYVVAGLSRSSVGGGGGTNIDNIWVLHTDASGNLLWQRQYGGIGIEQAFSVLQASDGGYVIGGLSEFATGDVGGNQGGWDMWLIKLASLPGNIEGHIYLDNIENCVYETGDTTLAGIVVMAIDTLTDEVLYGYTNAQGHYFIETDTISYLLSYILPSPYYDSMDCSAKSQWIHLDSLNSSANFDFFLKPVIFCPYMTVDVGTPILRRCFPTNYYISWCNSGTTTAEDAYVEVSFAPEVTVTGSSIPWTAVNGNTYTFPLGDVAALACGQFQVTGVVSCDSTYIGQTLCAAAHIFPDSSCVPIGTWSGAELEARAACVGTDSVEFRLKNIGTGNMPTDVPYLVIEDIIMRSSNTVQLNSGQSLVWTMPIDGLTQRIIAQQPDGHPYKTFTTAAITLCNTENLPPAPGPIDDFYTAYADDEEAPFIAIDCQQIIGAFDPNDKSVHPAGATAQGFITASTELTYKIRFQNTGNDTAFTVVVIDSLGAQLDPATLRPGASSHPYELDVNGNGVLKFTFRNILLPDSATNEAASHGFVQFDIAQKAGNPVGTVIPNNAGIYFDYNPPIVTNTVFNTIGKIYLSESLAADDPGGQKVELKAWPNPARDVMTLSLNTLLDGFDLLLFDVQGKMVQQVSATGNSVQLYRQSLPTGMYFFDIRSKGRSLVTGRLVFE